MFLDFFYTLRSNGAPVSTGEYLDFLNAVESLGQSGEALSLEALYRVARTCLVKDLKHYDAYDVSFAKCFKGLAGDDEFKSKLMQWLEKAKKTQLDEQRKQAAMNLPSEELMKELQERINKQKERHDGGNHWIGTGGTSAFGHSGYNPNGIRVGGSSNSRSALAVAGERNFKEYRHDEALDIRNLKVALKKMRVLKKSGAKSLNIEKTIRKTCDNMGEIELVETGQRKNNLRLILLMDVGGSMTPHSRRVEKLFSAAHQVNHFKGFESYYFHNIMYDHVYSDASLRPDRSVAVDSLKRSHRADTRVIIVGDAYMAPYELFQMTGSMRDFYFNFSNKFSKDSSGSSKSGIERVQQIKKVFPKSVWLNPEPTGLWEAPTISAVRTIFPMFELTLNGIDRAIKELR